MPLKFWGILLILLALPLSFLNIWLIQQLNLKAEIRLPIQTTFKVSLPNLTPKPSLTQPIINLEEVFNPKAQSLALVDQKKTWTLIATGDVIPARSVNFQTQQRGDFTWAFAKTAQTLKSADLTFINLETPLLASCPTTNEGMVFCGDSRHLEGLHLAGVDIVSLANNHSGNWNTAGIEETKQLLGNQGMLVTGIDNQPTYRKIKNINVAFLGFNDIPEFAQGIVSAQEEKIKAQIKEAKKQADLVVIAFHWGVEYTTQPTERQINLAHLAVDSGADLIIGNHPHWIQPLEFYKGKLIVYAHGNFIFDQMWSQKTREGMVGKYTFYDNKLIGAEFLPVQIDDYGQPHFLEGADKQRILDDLKTQSEILRQNASL